MKSSVLRNDILPFVLLLVSLVVATAGIDYLLNDLGVAWIGTQLGVLGTALIVLSFFYSVRKRKLVRLGSVVFSLRIHEWFSWVGCLLIFVHAGTHFNAILPWLALVSMLAAFISGLTGKYLLTRARRRLAEHKQLQAELEGVRDDDQSLFWNALAVAAMRKWRTIHKPITWIFVILTVLHILTVYMYGE